MTKIIFEVTNEQLKRLDSIGLLNVDKAGVFYHRITITSNERGNIEPDKKGE